MYANPAIIALEGENTSRINQEFQKISSKQESTEKALLFADQRIKLLLETQADIDTLEAYVESLHKLIKEQESRIRKLQKDNQELKNHAKKQNDRNLRMLERLEELEQANKSISKRLFVIERRNKK